MNRADHPVVPENLDNNFMAGIPVNTIKPDNMTEVACVCVTNYGALFKITNSRRKPNLN
jgi:hypothetical protein